MMQIHLIISITQLKPANEKDSYNQQKDANSSSVENDSITDEIKDIKTASAYKIEWFLNKHTRHHECSQATIKYLVKWKGYNYSHNVWYKMKDLTNVREFVKKYKQ